MMLIVNKTELKKVEDKQEMAYFKQKIQELKSHYCNAFVCFLSAKVSSQEEIHREVMKLIKNIIDTG